MKPNTIFLLMPTLAISLIGFLLPSCAQRVIRPAPAEAIHWEDKTPKEILSRLQLEQKKITDFTAGFSILLDPPPTGQPSNMQGVLFYARSKNGPLVRVQSISAFGRMIFDLVQKNDTIQIYIPSRQTLYSGRIKAEDSNAWQDVFSSLFSDMSSLHVDKNADLNIKKDQVILSLSNGSLNLDRKTGFVQQWVQEKRIVYYEDYLSAPGQPPFPTRIFVRSSDDSKKATCMFNQIQINKGIHHGFDLSDYRPKFRKDISELKR